MFACWPWRLWLLLLFATDCRSMGLRSQEHQRASRIPSQFSKEERVAMKETLKGAIQIPPVSFGPEESNTTALAEFGGYIYKVFPTVLSTSFNQHEVMGEYSHLFTVQGSDPSLQPCLLLAHFDVVPAPAEGWEVPPYSGLECDGFVNGWGTLDDKNSVMAFLQDLELLSFFISLGHDEEKISALLQSRGIQLTFIVDEGSFIFDGFIPDLKNPFAMIANSENGSMNLMLSVESSFYLPPPPLQTTSWGLCFSSRLEQTPLPNMFGSWTLTVTLEQLAYELPFPANIILSNLWLFKPLVSRYLERNYITNAMVGTTTALTMFNAGVKVTSLVLSIRGVGTVYSRQLFQHQRIVADDRVQFHVLSAFDPLPISPYDDKALGYQLLRQTIQSVFPEFNTITPGNDFITDTTNLTTGIYRFSAIHLQPEVFRSIHGIHEKISVQAYENQVKFFFELIQNADTDKEPVSHQHKL
uniref:Peptidase M20 domain containing 1 n=1 Tax=Aotus nancymaae TaxID=37293 RepID=A0A2K5F5R1_AOTNA